ncbi:MFS transporter [Actinomadura rupiterrae]|uniref:MFS transporter n=1 Tax=Actinomadura rupiterrae TaxID=559627 RepID=UPI0020A42B3A|nr:MFS transporter [Actinomadura rupiterrae]MCP2337277.1 sugar phosphate permease [Actinomadura rupiterrae]
MSQRVGARAGYRWAVLGIATFTQAASCFFTAGVEAMGVQLKDDLDLTTAQLGLLLSAAQIVPLIGLLVAGELLDRHNERWVVGIGGLLIGGALLAGSGVQGYVPLLVVLLVVGAGYSTAQPGGSKSVAAWFEPSQRGFAMGIRQAGLPLGGAIAAASLPWIGARYGLSATLVTGGIVALVGAAVFMGLYRQPPEGNAAPRQAIKLRDRVAMMREPVMLKIVLSGTALISVQVSLDLLIVLHLHERASFSAGAAALALVGAQFAGAAGRVGLAAASDRTRAGRYVTVMVCMAAVVAGTAVLTTPLGRDPVAACLIFGWLGFFGFGWYGPWVAYVAESAPPDRTGFALGLAMAANQVFIVVVPPAIGLFRDLAHGFSPVWTLLAAVTAVALGVTAVAEKRGRRATRPLHHSSPDAVAVAPNGE